MPPRVLTKPGPTLVLATLLLLTSACSDGDSSSGAPSSAESTTSSASPDPSGSPADETEATPTPPAGAPLPFPDVAPATGIVLASDFVQVTAPEGWEASESMLDSDHSAVAGRGELIILIDDETIGAGSLPELSLDEQAEIAIQGEKSRAGGTYERQPDIEIDGVMTAHFSGIQDDGKHHMDGFVIEHDGRSVSLTILVKTERLEREPDLVASVINSWTWL